MHGTRIRSVTEVGIASSIGVSVVNQGFHPANSIIVAVHIATPSDDEGCELPGNSADVRSTRGKQVTKLVTTIRVTSFEACVACRRLYLFRSAE